MEKSLSNKSVDPSAERPASDAPIYMALPAGPSDTREIQFAEIFLALWRRKWLVIAVVMAFTAVAVALSFVVVKTYRANVLVAAAESEQSGSMGGLGGQLAGIASLAGVNFAPRSTSAETIAILRSRSFLEAFIDKNQLLPEIFADKWNQQGSAWKGEYAENPPQTYDGYQRLTQRILNVTTDKDSGLITISIDWHDPGKAATWANDLVTFLNSRLRADARHEAEENMRYLNQELEQTSSAELRQGIYRLIENQINAIMVANVRKDYAFRVIDPAVRPNERDVIRPRRVVFLFSGFVFGGLFALFLVLFLDQRRAEAGKEDARKLA